MPKQVLNDNFVRAARTPRPCRWGCGLVAQPGPLGKHENTCAPDEYRLFPALSHAGFENVGDYSKCWTRPGSSDQDRAKLGSTRVHLASWVATRGYRPSKGQVIRHTCDHAGCGNPEHLMLGTQADNMADMWTRGRGKLGGFVPTRPHIPEKYKKKF